MSSILRALRKLEEEKAALGEGGVDIARDILKRSAIRPSKGLFWPLTAGVLFLLLLTVGTFFGVAFYKASAPVETISKRISIPTTDAVVPISPLIKKELTKPDASDQIADKTVSSVTILPAIKKEISSSEVRVKPSVQPAATRADGLPFLKLSGIAYRKNANQRIAIINDLPVMQGTAIEGAQVAEILPDRVILQWKGKRFEQKIESE